MASSSKPNMKFENRRSGSCESQRGSPGEGRGRGGSEPEWLELDPALPAMTGAGGDRSDGIFPTMSGGGEGHTRSGRSEDLFFFFFFFFQGKEKQEKLVPTTFGGGAADPIDSVGRDDPGGETGTVREGADDVTFHRCGGVLV